MAGLRRKLLAALVPAGAACLLGLFAALLLLTRVETSTASWWLVLFFVLVQVLALVFLWFLRDRIRLHFRDLERLHGAVVTLSGLDAMATFPGEVMSDEQELGRLAEAIAELSRRRGGEQVIYQKRMESVLAARSEPVVVVTEQGQVSLVNHAAKSLLGAERVRVGTSVFAALERDSVLAAVRRAHGEERPVEATIRTVDDTMLSAQVASLGPGEGGVLSFPPHDGEYRAAVEHDLSLHERPPVAAAPDRDTRLEELPALVLDCETTGLDVQYDRVVSLGAVRLHGAGVYPGLSFDRLVNPGMPIPAASRAVHGLSDEMVRDASGFASVFEDLQPLLSGCVAIGHNIAFDLAMFRREFALADLNWDPPVHLDSLLLAAALDPASPALDLDSLAAEYGVDVHGRHTALGDSLVTAEIYRRMLPRLKRHGVLTLGQAIAFSEKAGHLIQEQKAAGW